MCENLHVKCLCAKNGYVRAALFLVDAGRCVGACARSHGAAAVHVWVWVWVFLCLCLCLCPCACPCPCLCLCLKLGCIYPCDFVYLCLRRPLVRSAPLFLRLRPTLVPVLATTSLEGRAGSAQPLEAGRMAVLGLRPKIPGSRFRQWQFL